MTLSELKKLDRKELAKRFPFLQSRNWKGELTFYDEDIGDDIKIGDPILAGGADTWGWNDIVLCWAEKVKPYFDKMPKETQDNFYISELKEKYGSMRLYLTGEPTGPYEKISEYTHMVEHLSYYTCIHCGKLSKSSNGKKLLTWRSAGYWVAYFCKNCAKKRLYEDIKNYGVNDKWKNSHKKGLIKSIFKDEYFREEGDWFSRIIKYDKDGEYHLKYDCHELLEGVYDK
jgi:hypothetical protein